MAAAAPWAADRKAAAVPSDAGRMAAAAPWVADRKAVAAPSDAGRMAAVAPRVADRMAAAAPSGADRMAAAVADHKPAVVAGRMAVAVPWVAVQVVPVVFLQKEAEHLRILWAVRRWDRTWRAR